MEERGAGLAVGNACRMLRRRELTAGRVGTIVGALILAAVSLALGDGVVDLCLRVWECHRGASRGRQRHEWRLCAVFVQ